MAETGRLRGGSVRYVAIHNELKKLHLMSKIKGMSTKSMRNLKYRRWICILTFCGGFDIWSRG